MKKEILEFIMVLGVSFIASVVFIGSVRYILGLEELL